MSIEDPAEAYRLLIADVYELAGASRRAGEGLAGEVGQTVARWHVLSVVSAAPINASGVARRLGLARQSVHRVVDGLLADGLLVATSNPDHLRSPLLQLTASGRAVLASLVERVDRQRGLLLAAAGIEAEELLSARQVVARLTRALDTR